MVFILGQNKDIIITDISKYYFCYDYYECKKEYWLLAQPIDSDESSRALVLGEFNEEYKAQEALEEMYSALKEGCSYEVKA